MEPFNSNIDRFGGLNSCQQYFSLFNARIWRSLSLSLLSTRDQKIIKINFYTKIEFEKN